MPDARRPAGHPHRLVLPRPRLELGLAVAGDLLHAYDQSAAGLRRGARATDRRDQPPHVHAAHARHRDRHPDARVLRGHLGLPVAERQAGLGGQITIGTAADIVRTPPDWAKGQPYIYGPARLFIVNVPAAETLVERDQREDPPAGPERHQWSVLALYRKCPHLGCQIPHLCDKSHWFECLCHGSKYTVLGEKRDGPAPRGMDGFDITVDSGGIYIVDTSQIITGPPVGTVTSTTARPTRCSTAPASDAMRLKTLGVVPDHRARPVHGLLLGHRLRPPRTAGSSGEGGAARLRRRSSSGRHAAHPANRQLRPVPRAGGQGRRGGRHRGQGVRTSIRPSIATSLTTNPTTSTSSSASAGSWCRAMPTRRCPPGATEVGGRADRPADRRAHRPGRDWATGGRGRAPARTPPEHRGGGRRGLHRRRAAAAATGPDLAGVAGTVPEPAEHRQRAGHRPADPRSRTRPDAGRLQGGSRAFLEHWIRDSARTTTAAPPPACRPTDADASATRTCRPLITFLLEAEAWLPMT